MRRVVAIAVLAALSLVAATASASGASIDFSSQQIIAALNSQRAEAGIPPVREDSELAAGCAAYDDYVIRNGLGVADQHFESPALPGYTKAGDHAARTSVLAYEPASQADAELAGDPFYGFGWAYGDPWDEAAFHLFQLMNPALQVSGGDERTATLSDGQMVRLECLNTFAGTARKAPGKLHLYFYPGPKSTVALLAQNLESEPVLGVVSQGYGPPPIFVYFFGRNLARLRIASQTLSVGGKRQPLRVDYAGGLSGPAHLASARASTLSNPSAGFYSKIPAEAVREELDEGEVERERKASEEEEATGRRAPEDREAEERQREEDRKASEAELRIGVEGKGDFTDGFNTQ